MKFVTIRYNSGRYSSVKILKINLEQVQYINICEDKIEFIYQDCFREILKDEVLNFNEVKEIVENL